MEALANVPLRLRTKDICELAVRQSALALSDIPSSFATEALCEWAVRQDIRVLESLPWHLDRGKIYEAAIRDKSDKLEAQRTILKWDPSILDQCEQTLRPCGVPDIAEPCYAGSPLHAR